MLFSPRCWHKACADPLTVAPTSECRKPRGHQHSTDWDRVWLSPALLLLCYSFSAQVRHESVAMLLCLSSFLTIHNFDVLHSSLFSDFSFFKKQKTSSKYSMQQLQLHTCVSLFSPMHSGCGLSFWSSIHSQSQQLTSTPDTRLVQNSCNITKQT